MRRRGEGVNDFPDFGVTLLPALDPWLINVPVCSVSKANRLQSGFSQTNNIVRCIVDVDVGSKLVLVLHKTQIPIRDAVIIQLIHSLAYSKLVGIVNVKTMRDDSDSCAVIG